MDACVLIDYLKAGSYVLKLITKYLGQVHVVSPVVDEVNETNDSDLIELGLRIIEPELSDLFEAADRANRVKQTSFQDQLCLLTAKRQGFICITNDSKLRKTCKTEGVDRLLRNRIYDLYNHNI